MAAARSRSFTLPFCDADRMISNARAWVQRSLAMTIPRAWSITARVASDERSCAISAACDAIRTARATAPPALSANASARPGLPRWRACGELLDGRVGGLYHASRVADQLRNQK